MKLTTTFHQLSEEGNASFLLVNKGSFFSLGSENTTNFQGLHYLYTADTRWSYYKVIESIFLEKPVKELVHSGHHAERVYEHAREKFFLLPSGLVYDLQGAATVTVDLDCRDIYDYHDKGRIYTIKKQKDLIIIEYRKYAEDNAQQLQKTCFIVFKGMVSVEKPNQWVQKNYAYDQRRNSTSTFWAYRALRFAVKDNAHVLVTYAETKKEALEKMQDLEKSKQHMLHLEQHYVSLIGQKMPSLKNKQWRAAYSSALLSMEKMIMNITTKHKTTLGIFAGLPWFFQFWSRDELLSLHSLTLEKKYGLAKKILLKHIEHIQEDGRIGNITPYGGIPSADGVGWLFHRVYKFVRCLEEKRLLDQYFSPHELAYMQERLAYSLAQLKKQHGHDGLMVNNAQETWMDTNYANDTRAGKRIEIQCLHLSMLQCAQYLSKKVNLPSETYAQEEKAMADNVKNVFFHGDLLYDGVDDATIRPNIFLAYYAYPNLLKKQEWKMVFSKALEKLWLSWGGLASIAKDHHLFCKDHTGQNDQSYHRGDSWFFMNNLAAICLQRVDKHFFKPYIEHIANASSKEILFCGFMGHHAEISSASHMESFGCFAQSWSNALFLELMHEIIR
ncbi:hypothetical protein C4573_03845 [Candidatus Woesearchaeota archaeon]|nr:MAG: hypothetical protein C4573_03845 [Candidatus Woesearchaeota archaeon]